MEVLTGGGRAGSRSGREPLLREGSGRDGRSACVGDVSQKDLSYPNELQDAEQRLVRSRREAAGVGHDGGLVGLALSGGGIRSATFCLGFLQVLARRGLLRYVDLVSTVSGGGYIGAFLGRLFTREWIAEESGLPVERVEQELADSRSEPLRWLRDNGRFLAPNGSGDSMLAGAVMLRNLITVHLALAVATIGVFLLANLLRLVLALPLEGRALAWCLGFAVSDRALVWSPWLLLPVLGLLLWPAPAALAYWLTLVQHDGSLARRKTGALVLVAVVVAGLGGFVHDPGRDWLVDQPIPLLLVVIAAVAWLALALWLWVAAGGRASEEGVGRASRDVAPVGADLGIDRTSAQVSDGDDRSRARPSLQLGASWLVTSLAGLVMVLAWLAGGAWGVSFRIGSPADHGERALDALRQSAPYGLLAGAAIGLTLVVALLELRLRTLDLRSRDLRRHRDRLSRSLARGLTVVFAVLGVGLIDSLGQTVYAALWEGEDGDAVARFLVVLALVLAVGLLLMAGKLVPLIHRLVASGRLRIGSELGVGLVAVVVVSCLLIGASAIAHGISWAGQSPAAASGSEPRGKADDGPGISGDESRAAEVASLMSRTTVSDPGQASTKDLGADWPDLRSVRRRRLWTSLWALLLWAPLVLLLARPLYLVALSSHLELYASRLARTFLGASNEQRWSGRGSSLTEALDSDGTSMEGYRPHERGGPLHLINLTINETVSGLSQIEFRDRKGLPMAVGPCGLSVGTRFHGLWGPREPGSAQEDVHRGAGSSSGGSGVVADTGSIVPLGFEKGRFHALAGRDGGAHRVQRRSLEQWLAASGAALTTGLGWRTSLCLSIVLGLANIRLGHWWDSWISLEERAGVTPQTLPRRLGEVLSRIAPVYSYLLDEILARFHGPLRRYWYLSDGGHFENTGCYELIRRRVPLIICCDCGADPGYRYDDLANLVRRVRVDLGAEIRFVDLPEGSLFGAIGPISAIGQSRWRRAPAVAGRAGRRFEKAHCALAIIRHTGRSDSCSLLILVKPGLSGDEPVDLMSYGAAHPSFPQESTVDQVFDEAQWESYRKLGVHIAESLLDSRNGSWGRTSRESDSWWSLAALIRGELGVRDACSRLIEGREGR